MSRLPTRSDPDSHPLREDAPAVDLALAALAALATVALGGLLFRGASVAGRSFIWPAMVVGGLAGGLVPLAGRCRGRTALLAVVVTAVVSALAGRGLSGPFGDRIALAAGASSEVAVKAESASPRTSAGRASPAAGNLVAVLITVGTALMTARIDAWLGDGTRNRVAKVPLVSSVPLEDRASGDNLTPIPAASTVRWLTVFWCLAVCVWQWTVLAPEVDGFRLITHPCGRLHADQSLLGFSLLLGGEPVAAEELPAVEQVEWFSGVVRSDNNFRFLRSGYAYAAVWAAPLLGATAALRTVNWSAWLVALGVVWSLARRWGRSEVAASIATAFAAVGIGFALHRTATAPHLGSFALYFLGVYWLDRANLDQYRRGWSWHRAWGLGLGAMGLCYNVSFMLLPAYWLVSLRRQSWPCLAGATLLCWAIPQVWGLLLPALGINVVNVDREYLARALGAWRTDWNSGPVLWVQHALSSGWESLTAMESPLVLALGGLGAMTCLGRRRWLAAGALLGPVAACTVYAPAATARGYIVYGGSVVLYIGLGLGLARLFARDRGLRLAVGTFLACGLVFQGAWSTAHVLGYLGPAKVYFLGWDDGWPCLVGGRTRVVSLTAAEPTPRALGGAGPFALTHPNHSPATRPVPRRSRLLAIASRLPMTVLLAALVCALGWERDVRRRIVFGLLVAWPVGAELSYQTLHEVAAPSTTADMIPLPAGEHLTYRIAPAEAVRNAASSALGETGTRLEISCAAPAAARVRLEADARELLLQRTGHQQYRLADPREAAWLLSAAEWSVQIEAPPESPLLIPSWQSGPRPGRAIEPPPDPMRYPSFELRVRDDRGFLRLAAF